MFLPILIAAFVAYFVAILVVGKLSQRCKWSDLQVGVIHLLLVAVTLAWSLFTAEFVVKRVEAEKAALQAELLECCQKKEPIVEIITERGVNL